VRNNSLLNLFSFFKGESIVLMIYSVQKIGSRRRRRRRKTNKTSK